MLMQPSPLLNQEINAYDYNEPVSNPYYQQEINTLYQEISKKLSTIDHSGTGKVSENDLFTYLQSQIPKGKMFNATLFKKLLTDIDISDDLKIDINDFTKNYIKNREELKLSLESLKKGYDKEKVLKEDLSGKIQKSKNEPLNNGMSPNTCINIEIGKIEFLNNNVYDDLYMKVSLDNQLEKKTSVKKGNDINFPEKLTFPIKKKESILNLKLVTVNNPNDHICEADIPIYQLIENEEIEPSINLTDYMNNTIAQIIQPKILFITSFYEMYQKQYDNVEKNITVYKDRISELSNALEDLSAPFKKNFDDSDARNIRNVPNVAGNKMVDNIEGMYKSFFKKDIKWLSILKFLLYCCILTKFITTFTKPDFISIFFEMCLVIIINTEMLNLLFDSFKFFFIGMICSVFYDILDYFYLRTIKFHYMGSVESWVRFFGFLGFIGKCLVVFCLFVVNLKNNKNASIPQ
jgi:hypothetical protein